MEPRRRGAELKSLWQRGVLSLCGGNSQITIDGVLEPVSSQQGAVAPRFSLPPGTAGPLAICSSPHPLREPRQQNTGRIPGCGGTGDAGLPPPARGRHPRGSPELPPGSGFLPRGDTGFPTTRGLGHLRAIFESRRLIAHDGTLGIAQQWLFQISFLAPCLDEISDYCCYCYWVEFSLWRRRETRFRCRPSQPAGGRNAGLLLTPKRRVSPAPSLTHLFLEIPREGERREGRLSKKRCRWRLSNCQNFVLHLPQIVT